MNAGTAINTLLKAATAVTDLVSTRIFPGIIPAETSFPAITYSQLTELRLRSKDVQIPTGKHTFDINIYARNFPAVQPIAEAVDNTLENYSGTVNTVIINRIWKADESHIDYEDKKDLFHIRQTYEINLK